MFFWHMEILSPISSSHPISPDRLMRRDEYFIGLISKPYILKKDRLFSSFKHLVICDLLKLVLFRISVNIEQQQ